MTKKLIFQGEWENHEIVALRGELNGIGCQYLIPYVIEEYKQPKYERRLLGFLRKTLKEKGQLPISYNNNGFIPLETFIAGAPNMDLMQRMTVVAYLWQGFLSVTQATVFASKPFRLISLHPKNVFIKLEGGAKTRYEFRFGNYIPAIFYDDVYNKKNISKSNEYTEESIQKDLLYMSPAYMTTIVEKGGKLKKGLDAITLEDTLYSLGCLIAYIITGQDLMAKYKPVQLMEMYYNHQIAPIYDEIKQIQVKQFVQMLMQMKTKYESILDNSFITTLNTYLAFEEINPNQLQGISVLGKGAYAESFKAIWTKPNGQTEIVAVKQFVLDGKGTTMNQINVEYDLMKLCKCDNSVDVKGIVQCKKNINPNCAAANDGRDYAYIIMECCDLGGLDKFIAKNYNHGLISKPFIEHVFVELLNGLWYLHSQRCIVHRDIKPENVLLKSNPRHPECPYVKLSDLGVSKIISNDEEAPVTFAGSKPFMAPEIQNPGVNSSYTYKIDLWSLACTMYFLVTYELPFGYQPNKTSIMCEMKLKPSFSQGVWEEFKELKEVLLNIFEYDQHLRWGWPQIFRNNYVQQLFVKRAKRIDIEKDGRHSEQQIVEQFYQENDNRPYNRLYRIAYKKYM